MSKLLSLLFAGATAMLATSAVAQSDGAAAPDFVGSEACAGCHQAAAGAWRSSHHQLAWTLPDEATVLGDFDDAIFEHNGVTTLLSRRDGGFVVTTEGPDGARTDYRVVGVAGVAPLQQYLVETEPGRLQALDVAWDAEQQRWYHLYPDRDLPPGDGLHWTGPYKTWNARCAECHATGYVKSYDPRTHRYDSHQAEIGVGCEACHGPGEAHVAWAEAPAAYDATGRPGLTETGLTVAFSPAAPQTEIQLCAGCHSRREPFLDGNPLPGTPFHDAYRLSLLRDGLYHPDGSILDEVYVYGSFLQSKMYDRGVRCTDCHEPHAADLKAEGNAVCTQCHSPAGNARFASLRKAAYDDPAHHFHEPGTEGAACKSCHMIERVYMGIDGRRDHSFRIPRPDLSQTTASPNACNDCHDDRDAAWAAAELDRRFPESPHRGAHVAETFHAARRDPAAQADALLDIALSEDRSGIVRATALELLANVADERLAARAARLLSDRDPLVRAAAAGLQRGAPAGERLQRLAPLLEDERRAVRTAAARQVLDTSTAGLPPEDAATVQAAMLEWHGALLAKADYPETHLVIGGVALVTRNPSAAEAAFREAVRLDPQRAEAWTMIVRIRAALGDYGGALRSAEEAIAANPGNEDLRQLKRQLDAASPQ